MIIRACNHHIAQLHHLLQSILIYKSLLQYLKFFDSSNQNLAGNPHHHSTQTLNRINHKKAPAPQPSNYQQRRGSSHELSEASLPVHIDPGSTGTTSSRYKQELRRLRDEKNALEAMKQAKRASQTQENLLMMQGKTSSHLRRVLDIINWINMKIKKFWFNRQVIPSDSISLKSRNERIFHKWNLNSNENYLSVSHYISHV